jgi:hypothetical protein
MPANYPPIACQLPAICLPNTWGKSYKHLYIELANYFQFDLRAHFSEIGSRHDQKLIERQLSHLEHLRVQRFSTRIWNGLLLFVDLGRKQSYLCEFFCDNDLDLEFM